MRSQVLVEEGSGRVDTVPELASPEANKQTDFAGQCCGATKTARRRQARGSAGSGHRLAIRCKTTMGWVQRDYRENRSRGVPAPASSFARLTEEELETHLNISRYGNFTLPGAIRPSYDLEVIPIEGYRRDFFRDEKGTTIPVLMASVSRERLFDVFLDLLDPLGMVVDVVLETSHERPPGGHQDLYREQIDLPVLKSILLEFEDLLVNDGCAGVAVLNPHIPAEVQFDEHKLLMVYAYDLRPFENVLSSYGIPANPSMRFITEAEHVHTSSEMYQELFEQLRMRLGLDRAGLGTHP